MDTKQETNEVSTKRETYADRGAETGSEPTIKKKQKLEIGDIRFPVVDSNSLSTFQGTTLSYDVSRNNINFMAVSSVRLILSLGIHNTVQIVKTSTVTADWERQSKN